jgi:hypothetical protein
VRARIIEREQCAIDICDGDPPAFDIDRHHRTNRDRADFCHELLSHFCLLQT